VKYVFRDGLLVPKENVGPPAARSDLPAPFFARFEPMESPVTGRAITSERQRQRDMQEAGAYDPRDLSADHSYSRGREQQFKEARDAHRDRTETRGFEWGRLDGTGSAAKPA
jgi:hypothetical protein